MGPFTGFQVWILERHYPGVNYSRDKFDIKNDQHSFIVHHHPRLCSLADFSKDLCTNTYSTLRNP